MKNIFFAVAVVVFTACTPLGFAQADVWSDLAGALRKADAKAAAAFEKVDRGPVGDAFKSVFGLTYLGDGWKSLCAKAKGEWIDHPAECRFNVFDRF